MLGCGFAQPVLLDTELTANRRERYGALFHERRKHKGISQSDALAAMDDPLLFAALMVHSGDADGMVGIYRPEVRPRPGNNIRYRRPPASPHLQTAAPTI